MAVNFNPDINAMGAQSIAKTGASAPKAPQKVDFAKAIGKSLNQVNEDQRQADASIVDLLSGKNEDVNSVIASVAKADVSFKLLVGVRNKLVAAYKETMKMSV